MQSRACERRVTDAAPESRALPFRARHRFALSRALLHRRSDVARLRALHGRGVGPALERSAPSGRRSRARPPLRRLDWLHRRGTRTGSRGQTRASGRPRQPRPSLAAPSLRSRRDPRGLHVAAWGGVVARAETAYHRATEDAESERARRLVEATSSAEAQAQQARAASDEAITRLRRRHAETLAAAEAGSRRALQGALDAYGWQATALRERVDGLTTPASFAHLPWDAPAWQTWTPAQNVAPAGWMNRIGTFVETSTWDQLVMPALVPIPGRVVLFEATGAAKDLAGDAVRSLLVRLVATVPPGRLLFIFLDPVGRGQNVAAMMHLADADDRLVTTSAWTEEQQIEQRLVDMTRHIEMVNQKYLRDQYETIDAYNQDAIVIPEPYRILVVFDFPVNFRDGVVNRLVSVVQNAARCGISSIIVRDTARDLPRNFRMDDISEHATVISQDPSGERLVWRDPEGILAASKLVLDTPPPTKLANDILRAFGEGAKAGERVTAPFVHVEPKVWWQGNSTREIAVNLGPNGAKTFQPFRLGHYGSNTVHHALVSGQTAPVRRSCSTPSSRAWRSPTAPKSLSCTWWT